MKRIVGAFIMLAGISGCISFTSPPLPGDKKMGDATAAVPLSPTSRASAGPPPVPPPTPSTWVADQGHAQNGSYVDYTAARPTSPYGQPNNQVAATPAVPVAPPAPAPQPLVAPPPVLQAPGLQPAPLPSLLPVAATPPAPSPAPVVTNNVPPTMSGMPVVITPHSEQNPTRQVSFTQEEAHPSPPHLEPSALGGAKPSIPMPPTPTVKGSQPAEPRMVRGGAPLMRLVNTKRITLNFEVKDVGPSGLSSVELWYTQDCREWKKYLAPTKAKAYVVEVDEEGMYGFTLRARSGLGLGKEPPAAGDQPQVWVIVDLTKPDVQLTEVTPSSTKVQQVSIRWKASDKNLSSQPISLSYAEKEDGPWKVIATNLENSGHYIWSVPADAPPQLILRVEAIDLAGNIGRAQSSAPILLDSRVPSVSITAVESSSSH